MKISSLLLPTVLCVVAFPAAALADTRSATACAANLTANQRLIYLSVLPDLKRDTDLVTLIRAKTMALVTTGRLSMSAAPDEAKAAGHCLQMVHQ
jgi:hypothetical protein